MAELIPWTEFEKARKHTEKIINILYNSGQETLNKKPRTYRQKAGKSVEFGGKISASIYENFVFLDKLS